MATIGSQPVTIQLVPTHDAEPVVNLLKAAGYSHLREQQPAYLRWLCSHPDTPEELLFALAQFPELRTELAHRTDPWPLLEMLAEAFAQDEAILALGKRYYLDESFNGDELAAFLSRHAGHSWLLNTLCRLAVSSAQKQQVLREAVSQSADANELLKILDRPALCEQARTTHDVDTLKELYKLGEPAIWLALAGNRATPPDVLNELAVVRDVPRAADIRRAASDTLKG